MRLVLCAGFLCAIAFVGTHGTALAAAELCTVSGTVAFGNYNVFSGAVSITGSVSGTCTHGAGSDPAISITLGNGNNVQGSGNRAMKCTTCVGVFASDILQYQFFTTAAHTTIWKGATAVTATNPCASGCGGGAGVPWGPVSIFGSIFAAVAGGINDSAVGTYTDSVTATINY
jgi:spore coat protein U-like protein